MRVGIKGQPLYWTVVDGHVLVGRNLAEVVSASPRPTLSYGALAAAADGRASMWLSPFRGIHRLTFGHELRVSATGPRVRRWFHPESTPRAHGEPAVVMRQAITAAIDDATRGRTGAHVALSGGLDSTILLALAARNPRLRPGLRAFCASPDPARLVAVPGRIHDEWPAAAAVAHHVGVPAHRLRDEDRFNWLEVADDIHARTFMPVMALGNQWWLRTLQREAEGHGQRTILTGQSGNATFSNGRPSAPRPLRSDGTWQEGPPIRRLINRLRHRNGQQPPPALRPDLPVVMPDHVLDMDPWTRWCLVEPASAGAHDTEDVQWRDPLGSVEVITAAMSLPPSAWGNRPGDRTLARQVGRGLIPQHVRMSRVRGVQGADLPGTLLAHADSYAASVDRVHQSPSAREFLDTAALSRSVALLRGDLASAKVFQQHYLRPLAVGLFAAWWDERPARPTRGLD